MAKNGRSSGRSPTKVAKQLSGIDFPASKEDLIRHAQKGGTDADSMEVLKQMPDRTYEGMADVMKGVGEVE